MSMSTAAALVGGLLVWLSSGLASAQCEVNEAAKLTAPAAAAGDWFGYAVAIDGDTAVIGAYGDEPDDDGIGIGSAYVLRFDAGVWVHEARLNASDGAAGDGFGFSVAIDGDAIVVGSRYDDDNGSSSGSAYVFRFDGTEWIEEDKVTASDGRREDWFGYSVAIDGDVVVVGAPQNSLSDPGWAYVYRFDGAEWVEEVKLAASDGQAKDDFGQSVTVSGNIALIGAWNEGNTGQSFPDGTGAAYAFIFDGADWNENAKIVATGTLPGELDRFGKSVSLEGDLALIGTEPITTGNPIGPGGSAYLFRFDGGQWLTEAKLVASDIDPGDRFGAAVSLSGETALVGAWGEWAIDEPCSEDPPFPGVCNVGSAYLFQPEHDGQWRERAKFTSSDAAEGDLFAWSVAVSGGRAVVGAWRDDDAGADTGSAYAFDLACACPPDLNGDGLVNTQDFIAFLNAWAAGEQIADWNDDGDINTLDFLAYLNDWVAAC